MRSRRRIYFIKTAQVRAVQVSLSVFSLIRVDNGCPIIEKLHIRDMDHDTESSSEEVVFLDNHRLYPGGKIIHIFDLSPNIGHKTRFWHREVKHSEYLSVWAGKFLSRRNSVICSFSSSQTINPSLHLFSTQRW